MSKLKNQNGRWWGRRPRSTSTSTRIATGYALEQLESRILLSADLAAAAQLKPDMATETPHQAVILNVPETTAVAGQQALESLLAQVRSAEATVPQRPVTSPPGSATEFTRMFPNLPPFAADTPALHQALLELGKPGGLMDARDDLSDPKTLITDPTKSLNNPDNPTMIAGMTFLGQFLDHDLTFDRTSILGQPQDPASTPNARTPAFDLDSVYGGGPKVSPQLYDQSAEGMGIKFVIQPIPGSAEQSRGGIVRYDVPRDAQGVAVIADPRNDENLIISQLHLAFERFHNAVVDQLLDQVAQKNGKGNGHGPDGHGQADPDKVFAEARRTVEWHYQWIIVHEFLPKTIGSELVNEELTQGPTFYDARHDASIPVEFSVAAY